MADEDVQEVPKSRDEFMAMPEWVVEHKKKGLLNNQEPRKIVYRGTEVYVIDRIALNEAIAKKGTDDGRK